MATAFESPTSSPAAAPFHDDPFLHFDGSAPAADGFPASPDAYAPSPFGMPHSNGDLHDDPFAAPADSNGGPILPPPTEMGREEGFLLREWRRYGNASLPLASAAQICHPPLSAYNRSTPRVRVGGSHRAAPTCLDSAPFDRSHHLIATSKSVGTCYYTHSLMAVQWHAIPLVIYSKFSA